MILKRWITNAALVFNLFFFLVNINPNDSIVNKKMRDLVVVI